MEMAGDKDSNNGASEIGDPNQPDVSSQLKDNLLAVHEINITSGERAVVNDEAAVLSREKLVAAREDAAHLRENAGDLRESAADLREEVAHLREGTATARERGICAAEAIQAVSDNQMILLQQLVTAREDAAHLRENAGDLRENAADLRESAADLRENAADLREDAAHLREGAAISRELKISTAETIQAAYDDHIIKLQQANAHLVVATIEAHKLAEQVEATKVQLDHLAHHDVLTGLPNRILLQDRLIQAIELACRQDRQLAVMYMDLDQFKHINDSLGHAVGDKLLQSVAQRLVGCVRHSDTISRQGGDEFVVLLPYIEPSEGAAFCAQKMLAALALPHRIDQHELHISVSIGVSIYPDDGKDAETQIKNADTAMYHAKENGRNNYIFFEPEMNARAVQRQSIEASLRRAMERQEFVLYYQPKINLQSGMIVGVEALIRWQHPEQGLLPPAQFVTIAEDCGLILPMGRWVLREACLQARSWQQAGLPPIIVAVNISALEFRTKDFLDNISEVLEQTGLEPHYLELELADVVIVLPVQQFDVQSDAHRLRDRVEPVLDQFGIEFA